MKENKKKKTGLDNIFPLSVNSTPCVLPTLYSPMLDLDWTKVLVVFSALRFPNGKRTNNCVFDPGNQDSIFFIGLQRRKQHVRKHLCSRGGEIITLVSTFFFYFVLKFKKYLYPLNTDTSAFIFYLWPTAETCVVLNSFRLTLGPFKIWPAALRPCVTSSLSPHITRPPSPL